MNLIEFEFIDIFKIMYKLVFKVIVICLLVLMYCIWYKGFIKLYVVEDVLVIFVFFNISI